MDASTHLFFENLRLEPNWIDQHLMANFPGLSTTGGWPVSLSGCPLTDIGNYLLRVLHVLATFSESLVKGEVISKHIDERTRELDAENDCHTANLLDDKHEALRSIEKKLINTLRECETVWVLSPPTISAASVQSAEIVTPGSQNLSPRSEEPFLTTMTAEVADYEVPSIEQLRARGKGHYICPRGSECDKGGVQPNGQLTVYERNSAFRAHLQLHERMFRCDIPGCTNKKGFARIDQLERHKATTRHTTPADSFGFPSS